MSRVKKLAALRYRRFVAPVSVEEVLYRVNDAGCNIKKQTYLKYEGGTIPFNKADVKETVCEFFGVDSEFLGPNRLHHDLCTSIPELIDFRIGKDNKYIPIFEDFYQSSKTFEQINYPYIICNLIRYRGYHILLNGDAFGFRKRYADAFQEEIRRRVLKLDGAMGTQIQQYGLGEEDYRAGIPGRVLREVRGDNECLNLSRPDIILKIHKAYIEAGADIIETNTYYEGSRYTTEAHRKTLKINGWTFCPVDITDSEGVAALPVKGGKWFEEMHVGKSMLSYDSLLVLTHFKGHMMGGFGGSNKNIGIGCADGRVGKKEIHTYPGGDMWSISEEELMERISESTKATIDYFAPHVCYINTMRNMSIDCDCAGPYAEPVVTPDVGILASLDILAVDNACMDLIYNLPEGSGKELVERVESRHGLRQLSYMKELGMGHDRYTLIDIDHDDAVITAAEAVKDIKPGWKPDRYNTFWGRNKHK